MMDVTMMKIYTWYLKYGIAGCLKFISRILLYMYMTVGVAIMPTGQQLYSPTGFLPVPMSSPSGYAAGEYPNKAALSSLSMGCVYSIWSGVCKLDYGAVCWSWRCVGVGTKMLSFLLRLVTNYHGNWEGWIPMGRMATAWFQLVGSQTPLPPQSKVLDMIICMYWLLWSYTL